MHAQLEKATGRNNAEYKLSSGKTSDNSLIKVASVEFEAT